MYNISKSLFLQTGKIGKTDCTFGILANEKRGSQDVKKNYLDHVNKLNANRTPDKIAKRIRERDGNCGNYGPITNNCEHLATYVRYGVSRSLQVSGRLNSCNINVFILFFFYKVTSGGL